MAVTRNAELDMLDTYCIYITCKRKAEQGKTTKESSRRQDNAVKLIRWQKSSILRKNAAALHPKNPDLSK